MAASVDSLKQQQFAKSAFGIPLKSSTFSRIQPPTLHRISYLTGGLAELYEHVQNPNEEYKRNAEEASCFTDEKGSFCPTEHVPLLAKRYHFIRILGKGCSATLVEAVDTFRPDNHHVAIKVLSEEYYALGYQESNNVERLNCADPQDFSGTVRLLNKFTFGNHFCLVFELLHPKPLHQYFKPISQGPKKLQLVRKVAVRLLQVLGFLQQENVIHADLKPENILCRSEDLSAGVKVIDFGNAIHCVYDELSLYYDDFELQTLLYRAPEVVFGLPFGPEIDVWSVGCILAELYLGEPLFFAVTKDELLDKMVASLGPLPMHIFQRGKFYSEYERYIGKPQSMLDTQRKLFCRLKGLRDYNFRSFILAFLQYNPSDRISVSDAFLHPFLAPEVAARYLMPSASKASTSGYHRIDIPENTYSLSPTVCSDVAADRLSSLDLLRRGTTLHQSDSLPAKKPKRAIAEVAPFASKPDIEGLCSSPAVISVPVSVRVSSEKTTFEVAAGVLKQESLDTGGIAEHRKITDIPRDSNTENTRIPRDSKRKNTNIQRDYKRKIANVPIDSNGIITNLISSSNRTAGKVTKTSLPVTSLDTTSSEDQSSRQCERQIPFSKNSVKKEKNLESHPEGSAQEIITVNKKLKDPCGDGNKEVYNKKQDTQIEVEPVVPKRDSRKHLSVFQSILKRELKLKKKQHNTYKSATQTATLEKHVTVTCQDSVATSPSLNSHSLIHVDASENRDDTKGKEQRSMNEQHHRTRMSRFKHLEKMKRDAVQQNSRGTLEPRDVPKELPCNKSNQDGSPSIFIDNKKENTDKWDVPSETHTPERHSTEKGKLLLTPSSNPLEVSSDGLILLTPLSCTQNKESPKPHAENRTSKANPTRTPRMKLERVRNRIQNKQKISQSFGTKKPTANQADRANSHPETMPHSQSDAYRTGQNQIHERRHDMEEENFCTPNKNEVDSKSGGILLRIKEKHESNEASPGKNNVNSGVTLMSKTPVSVSQESLRSGNCTVQSVSTICSSDVQEVQVVHNKASKLEGHQSTAVKFTPRSSSRRSKSLAQERIKAKNFHQGEYWWKLSSREGNRREEEEISLEGAEEGRNKTGRSLSGEVPLAREEVDKELADIKDKGELIDCTAHQGKKSSSKNLFSPMPSRKFFGRSKTSCVKATEGMSSAHTHKTLVEDVYNFESSPDLSRNRVLLSKKQKKPSLKSERTSQNNIQKKLLKTQSHKHRKSTSSETKVKNPGILKRKMLESLIAEPQFTSRSDDNDFPDKSKHDLTVTPRRTLDSGQIVNEEEITTIQGLEKNSHIKRRRIKQDCLINSQVGQYQKIPEDWESCFKSVARSPLPQDEPLFRLDSDTILSERQSGVEPEQVKESDNTLSERQSGTEQCLREEDDSNDDDWYPVTNLRDPSSSQTLKKGSFDDVDDEVMLL